MKNLTPTIWSIYNIIINKYLKFKNCILEQFMKKIKKKKAINTQLILDFMKKNNLSKTKFCKFCKISKKSFNKIMLNDMDFCPYYLYNISLVLDVYLYDLFNNK